MSAGTIVLLYILSDDGYTIFVFYLYYIEILLLIFDVIEKDEINEDCFFN